MRIIGGQFKSRKLATFDGEDIRPTGDRAKEALFNILSTRTYGARVLDLFCGSGALGIESLSRGANEVIFNDASKDSLAVLRKNLNALKVQAKVYNLDFTQCLNAVKGQFDIIFIDPPYRLDYGVPAINKIIERNLLRENGVVVYERDREFADTDKLIGGVHIVDERKYGKTYLTFFALKKEE